MKKPMIYMIGNAHIDPVWLWRWQDGYAEVRATYRSALDRIKQFPDFVFTTACAAYYKWIEDSEPEMFAEIQQAVKDGRWYIVGGWWIQPDCNIPSGESFSRHSLYSQRYFEEKFGRRATIGWNVDSFGHNGNLPQIFKKSGIDSYIYMRPGEHEKKYPFSQATPFLWEGVDGSRVLAYNIPEGYGYSIRDRAELDRLTAGAVAMGKDKLMMFYGVGNHGGGPTINSINLIHQADAEQSYPANLSLATPDTYFNGVRAEGTDALPVVKGDLQHHAAGCYASYTRVKELNRRAEQRLLAAEKASALCAILLGSKPETESVKKAWEKVMFNQFHDVMGGCSIKEAYPDAEEFYGESLTAGSEIYNRALQKLTARIDTDKGVRALSKEMDGWIWEIENKGVPIVVFNPLSWSVKTPVCLNYDGKVSGITDQDGVPQDYQLVVGRNLHGITGRINYAFEAEVPAMGWRTYWLYKSEDHSFKGRRRHLRATQFYIENEFIRVEFEPGTGFVRSIFDLENNKEFLDAPARPVVADETELDTWGHIRTRFHNDIGAFENAEISVLENGPFRARVSVKTTFGASELEQIYTLYQNSRDVEVVAKLFWHEQHKLLKLSFPTPIKDGEAVYEIPYGAIRKPANGEEEPAQKWAAVESPANGEGLAVLNNGRYSYDVRSGDIRLTIIRSAIYVDHSFGENRNLFPEFQEQGEHEFAYIIRPYFGGYGAGGVARRAWELNAPLVTVIETYHKGALPQTFGSAEIDSANVILSVLKPAEDGCGFIVRLYESDGKRSTAEIKLPNLGIAFSAEFGPYEIKTFRISDGKASEVNLLEEAD